MSGRRPRIVFSFTFSGDRISAIEIIADPKRLETMDVATYRSTHG